MAKIMREETLRKSLEQLSDREREILLGRFYYQKSSTELGRQMNLSPGNVRMIQKRALEKLRMIMEKQGAIGVQATETLPELTGDNAL